MKTILIGVIAIIVIYSKTSAKRIKCYECDWVESKEGETIEMLEERCEEEGKRKKCSRREICRTTLKCRKNLDPVRFLLRKECVDDDEEYCQSVNTVGWLELKDTTPPNLVARRCCDYKYCNELHGAALLSVFLGQSLGPLTFCTPGWIEDTHCGESIYPDAGETTQLSGRVIGGADSREHEFPYQARISALGYFCGAVLITHDWVLTAAHCVRLSMTGTCGNFYDLDVVRDALTITFGEHRRYVFNSYIQIRSASHVIVHEDYDCPSIANDVALTRLDRSVGPSDGRIRPICRPQAGNLYTGEGVVLSGWGRVSRFSSNTSVASVLQYAPMRVITDAECRSYWGSAVTPGVMCATDGGDLFERGHCYGDSGGPLALKDIDGRFRLVGVVSWMEARGPLYQCVDGLPHGYSRVTHYLKWIDSHVN